MHLDGATNKHLQLQNVKINMDEKTIEAIKSVLAKGDRVELIPVKDGVKVVQVRRKEIKTNG